MTDPDRGSDQRPMPDHMDIDGMVVIVDGPVRSPQEMIDRYGFHPAQVVQNAAGTEVYSVDSLVRDVWFKAMWRAHWMTSEERGAWFTTGDWT